MHVFISKKNHLRYSIYFLKRYMFFFRHLQSLLSGCKVLLRPVTKSKSRLQPPHKFHHQITIVIFLKKNEPSTGKSYREIEPLTDKKNFLSYKNCQKPTYSNGIKKVEFFKSLLQTLIDVPGENSTLYGFVSP